MDSTTSNTNPYLSIDKKYFKDQSSGQYIVTDLDLINIPELRNIFDVSTMVDSKIYFDEFLDSQKLEIGLLFFKYYNYIIWKGDEQYFDLNEFNHVFEGYEILNFLISSLDPDLYFEKNVDLGLYILDALSDTFLLKLIEIYFFYRYGPENNDAKYIKATETFTDVDLNLNTYTKKPENIEFVVDLFNTWIQTSPNTIPFAPDYGVAFKELLQEKNIIVKINLLKSAIINFFDELSILYNALTRIDNINIKIIGNYGLEINIFLTINTEPVKFQIVS